MKSKKNTKFLNRGIIIGLRQAADLIDPNTSNLTRLEATAKLRKIANDIEKNINNHKNCDDTAHIIHDVVIDAAITVCIDLLISCGLYAVKSKIEPNTIIGGLSKQDDYEPSFLIEVIKNLDHKTIEGYSICMPGVGVFEKEFHGFAFEAVRRIRELYQYKGFLK